MNRQTATNFNFCISIGSKPSGSVPMSDKMLFSWASVIAIPFGQEIVYHNFAILRMTSVYITSISTPSIPASRSVMRSAK